MTEFEGLKLSKPVGFFDRELKLSFSDFLPAFASLAITTLTGGASIPALLQSSYDLGRSFSLTRTVEEEAYIWIYASIHNTLANLYKSSKEQFSSLIISEKDLKSITLDFSKSTNELIVEIDYNFFRQPHSLNLFVLFEHYLEQFFLKAGMDSKDVDDIKLKLKKRFPDELEQELKRNSDKYKQLFIYFNNPMRLLRSDEEIFYKELNRIPKINFELQGRESELTTIHSKLRLDEKRLIVTGLGGVGKTSFLIKFIEWYREDYNHIIWISIPKVGEINNLSSVLTGDNLLLSNLKFQYDFTLSNDENAKILLNGLQKIPGKNLIILDNISPSDLSFIDYIPSKSWTILASSRYKLDSYENYVLETLDETSALTLFLHIYPKGNLFVDDVKRILAIVGYHTLTIELISKVLKAHRGKLSIKELAQKIDFGGLNSKDIQIKVKLNQTHLSNEQREVQIIEHLLSVFDNLALEEIDLDILKKFSILPAIPIEEDFLISLFEFKEEEAKAFLDRATALSDQGWLIFDEENNQYRCHQMIQEIVRHQYKPTFEDHKVYISHLIVNSKQSNLKLLYSLLPFFELAIKYFSWDFPEIVILNQAISNFYYSIGDLQKSKVYLDKTSLKNSIHKEGFDFVIFLQQGDIFFEEGKFRESIENYIEALQQIDNRIGKGDNFLIPTKLSTFERIGNVYKQEGNFDKAKYYFEKGTAYIKSIIPTLDSEPLLEFYYAKAMYNLGSIASKIGDLDQSILLCTESIKFLEKLKITIKSKLTNNFSMIKLADLLNTLGLNYSLLGEIFIHKDDMEQAFHYLCNDFNIANERYLSNPMSLNYKRERAVSYSKLGDLNMKLKKYDIAAEIYSGVCNTFEEIIKDSDKPFRNELYLIYSYEHLNEVNVALGQLSSANAALDKALEHVINLYKANLNNKDYFTKLIDIATLLASQNKTEPNKFIELGVFLIKTVENAPVHFFTNGERELILSVQSKYIAIAYMNHGYHSEAKQFLNFAIRNMASVIEITAEESRYNLYDEISELYRMHGLASKYLGQINEGISFTSKALEFWQYVYSHTNEEKIKKSIAGALDDLKNLSDLTKNKSWFDKFRDKFK